MEDVLAVYARPYNVARPVVCVDEARKELRTTPRGTIPAEPAIPAIPAEPAIPAIPAEPAIPAQAGEPAKKGKDKREDYEYERAGWANLFVAVEPLACKRRVEVTDRRTSVDFAHFLKIVSDEMYPEAEIIVLVTDNLNTHKITCLYEAFEPEEAFRLAQRFEWHYTPEHGSWLNIAEIELSILSRQCLARRMNREQLEEEVPIWQTARNTLEGRIVWQFTTADARVKLKRLYPTREKSKGINCLTG